MCRDEDADRSLLDAELDLPVELAGVVIAVRPTTIGAKANLLALVRLVGAHIWGKVDVVFSGINLGLHVGNSMWHSGTLAAAKRAALLRHYDGRVFPTTDPLGRDHYWLAPVALEAADEGTDRRAIEDEFVSITPLRLDLTDHAALGRVRTDVAAE